MIWLVLHVERGVDRAVLLERQGHRLHHERHARKLDLLLLVVGGAFLSPLLQFGDVGVVEVGELRDRLHRLDHVGRDRLANPRKLFALDRPVADRARSPLRRAGRACAPDRFACRTAAITSSRVMRPPPPLPLTRARSTPSSRASRRTSGPAGAGTFSGGCFGIGGLQSTGSG